MNEERFQYENALLLLLLYNKKCSRNTIKMLRE